MFMNVRLCVRLVSREGASSSPSMGLQVATAWGWLESGYVFAHQTVLGTNHGKGGLAGGVGVLVQD